jgi:hypothetical protein
MRGPRTTHSSRWRRARERCSGDIARSRRGNRDGPLCATLSRGGMSECPLRRGWPGVERPDGRGRRQAQRDGSDPGHQRSPEDRTAASGKTVELTRGLGGEPKTDNRALRSDALVSAFRPLGLDGVEQVCAKLGQDPTARHPPNTKLSLQLAEIHIDRIGCVHQPASSASPANTASTARLNACQLAMRSTTADRPELESAYTRRRRPPTTSQRLTNIPEDSRRCNAG